MTYYFLGDFECARQYAVHGAQIWRSDRVLSPVEDIDVPAVSILCFKALLDWHFGRMASCRATMVEATSLAKELDDMHGLVVARFWAGVLAHFERNPVEVEHCASDLLELATQHKFPVGCSSFEREAIGMRGLPRLLWIASEPDFT